MKNKNPLLVPELREMLAAGDTQTLKDFCEAAHPAAVAELISALSAAETWAVLGHVDLQLRAEIFSHLDDDLMVEMIETLRRDEIARLLTEMPHDERADLFKRLPEERRQAVLPALAQVEREDIRHAGGSCACPQRDLTARYLSHPCQRVSGWYSACAIAWDHRLWAGHFVGHWIYGAEAALIEYNRAYHRACLGFTGSHIHNDRCIVASGCRPG